MSRRSVRIKSESPENASINPLFSSGTYPPIDPNTPYSPLVGMQSSRARPSTNYTSDFSHLPLSPGLSLLHPSPSPMPSTPLESLSMVAADEKKQEENYFPSEPAQLTTSAQLTTLIHDSDEAKLRTSKRKRTNSMNSNSEDTKVANRKKYARSIGVLDDDQIMNNIPANGLELISQTGNKTENFESEGIEKSGFIVVKNSPFKLVFRSTVNDFNLKKKKYNLRCRLVYDNNEFGDVTTLQTEPMQFRLYSAKSSSEPTDSVRLDCKIAVLSTQHEHQRFRVNIMCFDGPNATEPLPFYLYSHPIRVISKIERKPSVRVAPIVISDSNETEKEQKSKRTSSRTNNKPNIHSNDMDLSNALVRLENGQKRQEETLKQLISGVNQHCEATMQWTDFIEQVFDKDNEDNAFNEDLNSERQKRRRLDSETSSALPSSAILSNSLQSPQQKTTMEPILLQSPTKPPNSSSNQQMDPTSTLRQHLMVVFDLLGSMNDREAEQAAISACTDLSPTSVVSARYLIGALSSGNASLNGVALAANAALPTPQSVADTSTINNIGPDGRQICTCNPCPYRTELATIDELYLSFCQ